MIAQCPNDHCRLLPFLPQIILYPPDHSIDHSAFTVEDGSASKWLSFLTSPPSDYFAPSWPQHRSPNLYCRWWLTTSSDCYVQRKECVSGYIFKTVALQNRWVIWLKNVLSHPTPPLSDIAPSPFLQEAPDLFTPKLVTVLKMFQ